MLIVGLIGPSENLPRKSSITNIAAAAVAPILGMRNINTQNSTSTAQNSSVNGKTFSEDAGNKHGTLPQLIFNVDKAQQQHVPISPSSPTVSHKGPSMSYTHTLDGDPSTINNSIVNNNYMTPSNPNTSMTKGHSMTATQLAGVKNWWKNQMEYFSSDEEC